MPETDYDKYAKDPRIPCKYGIKCYQKNPNHHEKYKHPAKTNSEAAKHSHKKLKAETTKKEIKEVVTKCASDSEDYTIDDNSSSSSDNKYEEASSLLSGIEANENKNMKNKIKVTNDVSDSEDSDTNAEQLNEKQSRTHDHEFHNSGQVREKDEGKNKKANDGTLKTLSLDEKVETKEKQSEDNVKESKSSKREDNKSPNLTISDTEIFIKEKFLVEMPEDFFQFWKFCKKLKSSNPSEALKDIGLLLVGPFDVLMGKFNNVQKSDEQYLIHWRYYHDPPEFQTVLKGDDKSGYHIGYFRDSPEQLPVLLANNYAKKDGILHQMGGNIFTAVNIYLDELKKSGDPFKKMHIGRIQSAVKKEAQMLKIDLSPKTDKMVSREKNIVTRTFNKIGLVVPYDRKTQVGYRELAVNNKDLSTLFTKLKNALPEQKSKFLSDLQPVFTYASIATDECDFGTGIELGWNIIAHGVDSLDSTALRSLTTNYRLLKREAFAKIAEAHLKNRKRGCDLSIV